MRNPAAIDAHPPQPITRGIVSNQDAALATQQDILAALAKVAGPDGMTPLPQSGAIAGLTLREGKAYLSISIDPARASAMETMRLNAERAIKEVPGIVGALVGLGARLEPRRIGDLMPVKFAISPAIAFL